MSDEDFQIPEEEEHPEKLRKKWEAEEFEEEFQEKGLKPCPHCAKWISRKSFSCIYCGGRVFHESGLLGRMAYWAASGRVLWVLAALLIFVLAMVMVRF